MRYGLGTLLLVAVVSSLACSPKNAPAPSPKGEVLRERAREGERKIRVDRRGADAFQKGAGKTSLPDYKPLPQGDPSFDAVHYRVSLDFQAVSAAQPAFDGKVELTFKPLSPGLQILSLDSAGLEIRDVTLLNTFQTLHFQQNGEMLDVDLGQAYDPSDTLTVAITYRWTSSEDKGVFFRSRTGGSEVETIYSNSEPEEARFWFPANARPNDRATFEAFVRVPRPFVAVSNGALVNVQKEPGHRTYHWSQRIPMVSYLFVVQAGKFGVHREQWNGIPVEFYGPADDMARLSYSLRTTSSNLSFFSERIGFHYPYEKYAQVVVPKYMWGGMEHTTATTLTDSTVHGPAEDEEFSSESLVAHEMAHQWFGDLITCRSWDHLWLNEGFATYFDALAQEKSHGKAALLEAMWDGASWYLAEEDDDPRPVVFPYYRRSLDDYFDSHAYAKGAAVLHMLRNLLGDAKFFDGVHQYVVRNQNSLVTTDGFKRSMEQVAGMELGWFFDQWLHKPGYPVFEVSWSYDIAGSRVRLGISQTQDLTLPGGVAGTTPLFRGPIEVEVDGARHLIRLAGLGHEDFELPAAQQPRYVKFNSENTWLARTSTRQAPASWRDQLAFSEDMMARIEAAEALSGLEWKAPEFEAELAPSAEALIHCADRDPKILVRKVCIEAEGVMLETLADIPSGAGSVDRIRDDLVRLSSDPEWRARRAATGLLAKLPQARAISLLRPILRAEKKLLVLVAALGSVADTRSAEAYDLLVSMLSRSSHQDLVLESVLGGLGSLKDLRALDVGEEYLAPRYGNGVRWQAIGLLVQLGVAHRDQTSERVRVDLEGLLTDADSATRHVTVNGLGDLKNPAAIPALQRVSQSDPSQAVRAAALEAIEKIGGAGDS